MNTPVLYIGKGDNLRRRLKQLLRFGYGEPVGHWGGRYLWQLEGWQNFLVAWCIHLDAGAAEGQLLAAFFAEYGTLPFANLRF